MRTDGMRIEFPVSTDDNFLYFGITYNSGGGIYGKTATDLVHCFLMESGELIIEVMRTVTLGEENANIFSIIDGVLEVLRERVLGAVETYP